MKYFLVTVRRGHLGSGKSGELKFAIEAEDIMEACRKAQNMPMVKHSKPVVDATEITKEKHDLLRKKSAYDAVLEKKLEGKTKTRKKAVGK